MSIYLIPSCPVVAQIKIFDWHQQSWHQHCAHFCYPKCLMLKYLAGVKWKPKTNDLFCFRFNILKSDVARLRQEKICIPKSNTSPPNSDTSSNLNVSPFYFLLRFLVCILCNYACVQFDPKEEQVAASSMWSIACLHHEHSSVHSTPSCSHASTHSTEPQVHPEWQGQHNPHTPRVLKFRLPLWQEMLER